MQTNKKEAERREYEKHEKLVDKGNVTNFYEKIRRLTVGFKTGPYLVETMW